ncbi:hypothetical protein [Mycobacterium sp.]|jgi:hypothetical protein|uniref:hypothetical protein n=1 Tax=Mycobacterium sp. TaxID=1785 RepID=UPI002D4211F5|nr:hypothetical protein [Mycobacterium sp.]HZA10090.1 hypothetical protein [Mycobacterium sp.]
MSEAAVTLVGQAAFSFVGTVERLGAATMEDLPVDERTAVVRVDQVLQAPDAFAQLAGMSVTVQLLPDTEPPEVGSTFVFFANGLVFGAGIALTEIGRLPVEEMEPHIAMAAAAGGAAPLETLQRQVTAARLRAQADSADAIVLARVVGLERASGSPLREHDPDWWRATLHVIHVERGDVQEDSEVKVLYANSLDVRWREAPKPKASQNGLWFLHATEGELAELAPFEIVNSEDLQPVQNLELLHETGS